MTRLSLIPAVLLLAGCEGGFAIPDLREMMSSGGGGEEEMTAEGPLTAMPETMVAKERLIAAAEANGCVINIDTIAAIMQEAAVGNAELPGLVTELEGEGRVAADGDSAVRVTTPACATT